ncbi:unnamed protein product [Rotaria magnacalcarata]|uniref:EF-hand domain-containing protein n=7 Tax=Rotaria magnacalcarata TaxID=392030 RepID=A0A819AJG0_9BILA|nr:unnamed protein product [Rotaria magnacalcarata]CAF3876627.1 unnamed protein product [Rotaria magnacalcarata]
MGKNKDRKKKGAAVQKTATKAKKKTEKELQKQIEQLGEEQIEQLITKHVGKDTAIEAVIIGEPTVTPPSRRANVSLTEHPLKDELILFGGEFFDGRTTILFNDLYIYDIKKQTWKRIQTPQPPPPRSSHQAISVPMRDGELWMFGGEYTSPSQSQFYHYNDLHVLHLSTLRWEKQATDTNGPSGRSGHRMTSNKRKLFVFGGFQDYITTFRYFNDLYTFCLDTFQWTQLKPMGQLPSPRSAAPIVASQDGSTLFIIGGYSKETDVKGVVHTDVFALTQDETSWQCRQVKVSGVKPDLRCGSSLQCYLNTCILFGGVTDNEIEGVANTASAFLKTTKFDPTRMRSVFYNDLHRFDLHKLKWYPIELKSQDNGPSSRMNAALVIKQGILYLYGGLRELDEKKQYTLGDFYSLNLSKVDAWTCIHGDTQQTDVHIYSDSSSDDDDDDDVNMANEDGSSSSSSSDSDDDDDSDDESIEIEAPDIIPNETDDDYYNRTREFWLSKARKELKIPDSTDDSKKAKKAAQRATSNVFTMFDQKQVQEFKEAFGLMDQDRDGSISFDDLKEVYSSLGKAPKESDLKQMIEETGGPVNFTKLLQMFGDRLHGTDPEDVLMNGFKTFDTEGKGFLNRDSLRDLLTTMGHPNERLTDIEFNQMLEGAPIDAKGLLDFGAFTKQIKRGKEDE